MINLRAIALWEIRAIALPYCLTSIVIVNQPKSVDHAGKPRKNKCEHQADPKMNAKPNRQKYTQWGKENRSDYVQHWNGALLIITDTAATTSFRSLVELHKYFN